MADPLSSLRLNVGFIIHQNIGFSRDFDFDLSQAHLPPDLNVLRLQGVARVTRTPQGLLVQVKAGAELSLECVRCLKNFPQNLQTNFSELYAFNHRSVTESGIILPEDGKINLAPLIREYIVLEIPINPLCKPDCRGLCPECGENLNETNCNHQPQSFDPRLSVLKSLLEKQQRP